MPYRVSFLSKVYEVQRNTVFKAWPRRTVWPEVISLSSDDGGFAVGEEGPAEFALSAIATPGGTMLSAIENDLKVQAVPSRLGKEALQIALGLEHVLSGSQFPTLGQTVDVGIHGKSGHSESLGHDHRGCFVPHPG